MLGQQRLDLTQHFIAGEQIEKSIRIAIAGTIANSMLFLCACVVLSMHSGWLLGCFGWVFRNSTLSPIEPAFFLHRINCLALSKCHSGQSRFSRI